MEGMTARMMNDFHKSGMKGNKMEPPKEEEEIRDDDSSNPFGQVKVEIQTEATPTPQVNAPKVYTGSGGYTYQVNPDSTIEILSAPKAEQQGLVVKPTGRNARAYAAIAQEIMGQDEAIASLLQPMVEQAKKASTATPSSVRSPPPRPAGAVSTVVEMEKPEGGVRYPEATAGPTAFVLKPPPPLVEGKRIPSMIPSTTTDPKGSPPPLVEGKPTTPPDWREGMAPLSNTPPDWRKGMAPLSNTPPDWREGMAPPLAESNREAIRIAQENAKKAQELASVTEQLAQFQNIWVPQVAIPVLSALPPEKASEVLRVYASDVTTKPPTIAWSNAIQLLGSRPAISSH